MPPLSNTSTGRLLVLCIRFMHTLLNSLPRLFECPIVCHRRELNKVVVAVVQALDKRRIFLVGCTWAKDLIERTRVVLHGGECFCGVGVFEVGLLWIHHCTHSGDDCG